VKYQAGEPEEWKRGVEALKPRVFKDATGHPAYDLEGPCPRCLHAISTDITEYIAPVLSGGGPPRSLKVRVVCNCGLAHEGRPPDAMVVGCGAEGGVKLDF
jgi:hypothetical protein